jgi:hypothetical protein
MRKVWKGYENMKEVKIKNFKVGAVGLEMEELIKYVQERFNEEYGFKPDRVKITNLIAQRVKQNKLF